MSLEKISVATSEQLRQASRDLSTVSYPVAQGFNSFISALLNRTENRLVDEEALTLYVGVEGYIGIETYNRSGHSVLRAHIDVPEGQRAVIRTGQPLLLTDVEGQLLLSDIHNSIDNTPVSRFASQQSWT